MITNWKFAVIIIVATMLFVGLSFAFKNGNTSFSTYMDSFSTAKKLNDSQFLKTPRQKVCYELIENIKKSYKWYMNRDSSSSRLSMVEAIQIYNGIKGQRACDKSIISIMEDVKNGK